MKCFMKIRKMWAVVALMAAAVMTGCGSSNDETTKVPAPDGGIVTPGGDPDEPNELRWVQLTRAEQQLVQGNNDFAFNLFRKVAGQQNPSEDGFFLPPENKIISPISITYALGMLNNGASGETQAQINKVLGFGETGADGINDFCRKMLTEAPTLDKLTKVMIANTIYLNQPYALKPAFLEKAKTYYDAEPETRDFHDGKTVDVINQWASDHTEKMIEKVLDEESFNPEAVSYLLNATYFKGAWSEKFDEAETKEEEFNHYGPDKVMVMRQMMHQEDLFGYTENDLCQALTMPYGNGAYRMTILLPREGKTVSDVVQTLTAETWERHYRSMGNAIVDVKLPRFESNTSIDLKEAMAALGMPDAFDPDKAEFPDFTSKPTYISLMKQVARIKVSEEGTEAAAVTVIENALASIGETPEPQHVVFHADRPFLYVISEMTTGTIFFIGQLMK